MFDEWLDGCNDSALEGNNECELLTLAESIPEGKIGVTFDRTSEGIFEESIEGIFDWIFDD